MNKHVVLNLLVAAAMVLGVFSPLAAAPASTPVETAAPTSTQPAAAQPSAPAVKKAGPELRPVSAEDIVNLNEKAVYIVQLQDLPLALYKGGIDGLAPTNPAARGESKFDAKSAASLAYMDYLAGKRAQAVGEIEKALGRSIELKFEYKATLNGFAAEMTAGEAAAVANLPGIKHVEKEKISYPQTDAGPAWIGAPGVWNAVGGTYGEGVIVGVIDTGIDPWNPSFADIGGDGYDHTNPFGADKYVGVCDPNNTNPPAGVVAYDSTFECNDKLIGVWGYTASDPNPRDGDGHGSHTASTAGGNIVYNSVITTADGTVFMADISGVAPHANIIMYDGCIDGGGCPGASLTAARDQALLDGVDVINYSIGGGAADPWSDTEDQQWLALRDAGVFVATSSGNSGPAPETMGDPGLVPWITSVGANSHNRAFLSTLVMTNSNPLSPTVELDGLAMTGALVTPTEIVFAADYGDALCDLGSFAPGTFSGQIVVCERGGGIGRVDKGQSVKDGGAGGYILAQPDEFGGGEGSLVADPHVLPAVHIDYYNYQTLLAAHAAGYISGTITGGSIAYDPPGYSDVMAEFSSRGPNVTLPDIVKPDVTAPGRSIWGAYHQGAGGDGTYTFNVIGGTSMASPHVAGAFALLKALHPNWSPAEAQSALMMTARHVTKADAMPEDTIPFDEGSGEAQVDVAAKAGFVLDVTTQEYQDANPGAGGDPKTLNLASVGNSQCLGACSWTRELSSTLNVSVDWTVSVTGAAGLVLSVDPASFTLAPYATQTITIEADVSAIPSTTTWQFGQVIFTPDVTDTVEAHMPVAVLPTSGALPTQVDVNTRRSAGSQLMEGLQSIEIITLTVETFGLTQADLDNFGLVEHAKPTTDFPDIFFTDTGNVYSQELTVPAGAVRLVTEIADTTSPDLDMLLMYDADDDGVPELQDTFDYPGYCQSAISGPWEYCNINEPTVGRWFALVLNYQDSVEGQPDQVTLATALVPDASAGNMTIEGPTSVPAGDLYDLRLHWDTPTMIAGDRWYGAFSLGTEPGFEGNIGTIPVDIVRMDDDVVKTASPETAFYGDTVTYTITIQPNVMPENMTYVLTDTIPAGLTYVPGSAHASAGTVNVTGNELTWSGIVYSPLSASGGYNVSTNATDPLCDTGFGGYVDLSAYGIYPQSNLTGDAGAWTAFSTQLPIPFFNVDQTGIGFTTDGFAYFDSASLALPANTNIPDPANPNEIAPILWSNLNIVYDGTAGAWRGISLATNGTAISIVEYDDVEIAGGGPIVGDFEAFFRGGPISNAPGVYEFIYAYDNIQNLPASVSVGAENLDASQGTEFLYGDPTGVITDGLLVCFDYFEASFDPIEITYQVTVDEPGAGSPLTNEVLHDTNNPGSQEATTGYDLYILGWEKQVWINGDGPFAAGTFNVAPGDMVTIVDRVGVESNDPITFTLAEAWDAIVDLQTFEFDFGDVTSGTGTLTWEVEGGVANTWYALTKTFEVLAGLGWGGTITETLDVAGCPTTLETPVHFHLLPQFEKDGPATANTGELVNYTLTIESPNPILIDGSMMLTDALPSGVEYAGNLTFTYGSAWYISATNTVYWNNAMGRVYANQQARPASEGPAATVKQADDTAVLAAPQASQPAAIPSDQAALLTEGFEGGVMPPAGWSVINSTASRNWQLVDANTHPEWIHTGDYAAWVNYVAEDQDEWLISPLMDLTQVQSPTIEFWVYANNNWVSYAELQFLVIDGSGTFTDTLWQQSNETWPYPSAYHQVALDLSAYEGQPVYLAWRYVGNDGDSIALDDILLTGDVEQHPTQVTIAFDALVTAAGGVTVINVAELDYRGATQEAETSLVVNGYTIETGAVGNGDVAVDPDKPVYSYGEMVTLTAMPDTGWLFVGWSGDASGTTNPVTITVDNDLAVTATFALACVEVAEVDLSITGGTVIYTDTLVTFSVDIMPNNASKPYTYTVDYGDGITATAASSADPLALSHTFTEVGTYTVEIEVWNCAMTAPVTDTVQVVVSAGEVPTSYQLYLPLIAKNN